MRLVGQSIIAAALFGSAFMGVPATAARVLMRMGQLTAESLNLPVQKFDPAEYYNLVKSAPTKRSARGSKLDRVLKALSP